MLFDKSGFAKPIQCGEKFMTNREMMEIAMRQSAEDMGCREEDFKTNRNVVFPLKLGKMGTILRQLPYLKPWK